MPGNQHQKFTQLNLQYPKDKRKAESVTSEHKKRAEKIRSSF